MLRRTQASKNRWQFSTKTRSDLAALDTPCFLPTKKQRGQTKKTGKTSVSGDKDNLILCSLTIPLLASNHLIFADNCVCVCLEGQLHLKTRYTLYSYEKQHKLIPFFAGNSLLFSIHLNNIFVKMDHLCHAGGQKNIDII